MTVYVVHVGNDPAEPGSGISAVIADHLVRASAKTEARALTSYRSTERGAVRKSLPALRVVGGLLGLRRRGTVVHVHLSHRASFLREGGLLCIARLRGLPTIATVHGSSLMAPTLFSRMALRAVGRVSSVVHVLSDGHRQALTGAVSSAKLVVVPNSVVVPSEVPLTAQREKLIVFGGEIGERKGVDVLLRAWRALEHGPWRLACYGPAEARFQSELARRMPGAQDVEIHGPVPREQLIEILRSARIAVLPSRSEALPMFVLEAMAQGCAVVASSAGSVAQLLDGGAGVVVPIADEAALAAAISDLLANPHRLKQIAVLGRTRVAELHGDREVSREWDELYCAAAARQPVRG